MDVESWVPLQLPGDCRLEMHSGNGLTGGNEQLVFAESISLTVYHTSNYPID